MFIFTQNQFFKFFSLLAYLFVHNTTKATNTLDMIKVAAGSIFESRSGLQLAENNNHLPSKKKPWTVMVYIAADNDLRVFVARNIKQMANIGSSELLNIVVHLDIKITGNKKITRRYYIDHEKIIHMNASDASTSRMDSGSPETLISFADWAIKNYPADHYSLILWNHGTGIVDPNYTRIINPSHLFMFNPDTNKWELDRSIGFFDYMDNINNYNRGICWDDTTGNYLTNQTLEYALKTITEQLLDGKKLSIIGFDACLMSMLEITNFLKNYADYCVASEEVEMGRGWDYNKVFAPLAKQIMSPREFASHIVLAYKETYMKINDDHTLSAIDLSVIKDLEEAVNELSQELIHSLSIQKHSSVMRGIKTSIATCTQFDGYPSYIDLHHFLQNLANNCKNFDFIEDHNKQGEINKLSNIIHHCMSLVEKAVTENTVGPHLSKARGISIHFPDKKIHSSYKKCNFAQNNSWLSLISSLVFA